MITLNETVLVDRNNDLKMIIVPTQLLKDYILQQESEDGGYKLYRQAIPSEVEKAYLHLVKTLSDRKSEIIIREDNLEINGNVASIKACQYVDPYLTITLVINTFE
jgi:hypothetical protein